MDVTSNITRYSINAADEIVSVGGDWDRFARENDSAPDLLSANILHRSFWDFISGDALRYVYRRIMSKVRAGESMDFTFRCDSPALRRFLNLRMSPTPDGGIEFVTETICTEEREFQLVFGVRPRADWLVVMCSWCNKIQTGAATWQEPEDATRTLALFETDVIPALSHGMCEQCYRSITDKTEAR